MRIAFVLALALGLAVPFASADPAAAGERKGVTKKYSYKSGRTYQKRRSRRVRSTRPQVRGFRLRLGGYSYRPIDRHRLDPGAEQPSDFGGRYEDSSPSFNGIIPTHHY